jgi:isocitrate lyase
MLNYKEMLDHYTSLREKEPNLLKHINAESKARMRLQNRFHSGLDIARYTADIMHADMKDYDGDSSKYTQSLGCWHGFTAQQMMMEIKKSQKTTAKSYVYLSGWMVAALRSEFGPLPDQSMHEKTTVPNLIKEIYTFLKRADSVQLQHLFNELDEAYKSDSDTQEIISKIDNFETHVVPIIILLMIYRCCWIWKRRSYLFIGKEDDSIRSLLHSNRESSFRRKTMWSSRWKSYCSA